MTDPFHAMPPYSDDSATKRRKEAESRLKDADEARNGAAGACPCPCPCMSYMAAILPIHAMRTRVLLFRCLLMPLQHLRFYQTPCQSFTARVGLLLTSRLRPHGLWPLQCIEAAALPPRQNRGKPPRSSLHEPPAQQGRPFRLPSNNIPCRPSPIRLSSSGHRYHDKGGF